MKDVLDYFVFVECFKHPELCLSISWRRALSLGSFIWTRVTQPDAVSEQLLRLHSCNSSESWCQVPYGFVFLSLSSLENSPCDFSSFADYRCLGCWHAGIATCSQHNIASQNEFLHVCVKPGITRGKMFPNMRALRLSYPHSS